MLEIVIGNKYRVAQRTHESNHKECYYLWHDSPCDVSRLLVIAQRRSQHFSSLNFMIFLFSPVGLLVEFSPDYS